MHVSSRERQEVAFGVSKKRESQQTRVARVYARNVLRERLVAAGTTRTGRASGTSCLPPHTLDKRRTRGTSAAHPTRQGDGLHRRRRTPAGRDTRPPRTARTARTGDTRRGRGRRRAPSRPRTCRYPRSRRYPESCWYPQSCSHSQRGTRRPFLRQYRRYPAPDRSVPSLASPPRAAGWLRCPRRGSVLPTRHRSPPPPLRAPPREPPGTPRTRDTRARLAPRARSPWARIEAGARTSPAEGTPSEPASTALSGGRRSRCRRRGCRARRRDRSARRPRTRRWRSISRTPAGKPTPRRGASVSEASRRPSCRARATSL